MGMRFGGCPPSADLPKDGFPKPVGTWALAKRANSDVLAIAGVGSC